ncbi:hypothetical protein AB718_19905, partial [Acinetobacter baumannii]
CSSDLAANAGVFVAANRHFRRGFPPAVDPADAGFQLVDNSVSAVEVGRHHAGGEAVFGGVGAANDLRFVGIAEDRHHRAEDLFADRKS